MSYHKLAGSEPEEGEVNLTHVHTEVPQDSYQKLDSERQPDGDSAPAATEFFKVEVTDAKARNFDGFEDTNRSPLLKDGGEKTVPYEVSFESRVCVFAVLTK